MRSDNGLPGFTALSNGFRREPTPAGIMLRRIGWPVLDISHMLVVLQEFVMQITCCISAVKVLDGQGCVFVTFISHISHAL